MPNGLYAVTGGLCRKDRAPVFAGAAAGEAGAAAAAAGGRMDP